MKTSLERENTIKDFAQGLHLKNQEQEEELKRMKSDRDQMRAGAHELAEALSATSEQVLELQAQVNHDKRINMQNFTTIRREYCLERDERSDEAAAELSAAQQQEDRLRRDFESLSRVQRQEADELERYKEERENLKGEVRQARIFEHNSD